MKKYLKYGSLCCGLLWLAACSSDCPGEGYTDFIPELPGEQFVVDYSVGETASRAFEANLPANKRISSLTYLLYDGDALVKKREIPAIKTQTKWPLKRETMTWEQREALKDTLTAGVTYTAVFVANEDKTLFEKNLVEADTTYLTGEDKLSTVALQLPSVPFQDNSMFYLAKETIDAATTAKLDRHHPLNKPVTLQRIVSRTDIRRKATLGDADILAGLEKGKMNEKVITAVDKALDEFLKKLKKQQILNITFTNNCEKLVNTYMRQAVKNKVSELMKGDMLTACKENSAYQSRTAEWVKFTDATLEFSHLRSQFLILTLEAAGDGASLPALKVEGGMLSFCSFSNVQETDPTINALSSMNMENAAGDTLGLGAALPIRWGKNMKKIYECNPIDWISSSVTKEKSVELDLSTLVGNLSEVLDREGFNYEQVLVTKTFFQNAIENVLKLSYKNSTWNAFQLPVPVPDVSGDGISFKAAYTEQPAPTPAPVP